jgi:hypothetical protein
MKEGRKEGRNELMKISQFNLYNVHVFEYDVIRRQTSQMFVATFFLYIPMHFCTKYSIKKLKQKYIYLHIMVHFFWRSP